MEHTQTYAGVPAARRRRWIGVLLAAALAFAALIGIGFATGLITVYDAAGNAGIVIGPECHNAGLEWRGTPGLFFNACD